MTLKRIAIGNVFGRLTVQALIGSFRYPSGEPYRKWLCYCECGTTCEVASPNLSRGDTQSCGCLMRQRAAEANTKHGHAGNRTYETWCAIKSRCENPTYPGYKAYGGRGIFVCEEWRTSYERFLSDMGERPSADHSIDRKNNAGPYSKDNCRWATRTEQANNRRSNRLIEWDGVKMTARQWSEKTGIPYQLIRGRVQHGVTGAEIFKERMK